MNPFTLIRFFLVIFCTTKYTNSVPITSNTSESAVRAKNLTNFNNIEKLYQDTINVSDTLENAKAVQTKISSTKRRRHSETQKPKPKVHRKINTTEKPMTTKPHPTESAFVMPNLFMSTGWGPGR